LPILFPGVTDPLHIRLFSTGYIELGPWWTRTDTLRNFWRLYSNDDEGAALVYEDQRFGIPAARQVVVPPGLEFDAVLDHPVRQVFAHFEFVGWPPEAVRELVPEPVVADDDPVRSALDQELRTSLSQHEAELDPVLASRVKALIHLTIADVLRQIPEDRAEHYLRITDGQEEILDVLQHIHQHIDSPLSNADLASIAHSSESRFIRRFREVTGQTPARYVQDRRLRQAAELLVSTDRSIDEIAERCGFANRYYFTRVFATRMGVPPARYRSDRPHVD
jgi:AraC-like DNA-binding protein